MPELPDVQVFKEYVDATALHRHIDRVHVDHGRELQDVSARTLRRHLTGTELSSTRRHGKHLFVATGRGEGWLRLHFGMTGTVRAWEGPDPEELDPAHVRLRLDFQDGRRLAYSCPRRFGEVGWVDDPGAFVETRDLGPDARALDVGGFRERLEGRRGMIKPTLMNQEVLAGLGNIYVDEILYQAAVHPRLHASDLDAAATRKIHRVMLRVLDRAVQARADPDRVPRAWLLTRREPGRACSRCDGTVDKTVVSGRATYFCPTHQRE